MPAKGSAQAPPRYRRRAARSRGSRATKARRSRISAIVAHTRARRVDSGCRGHHGSQRLSPLRRRSRRSAVFDPGAAQHARLRSSHGRPELAGGIASISFYGGDASTPATRPGPEPLGLPIARERALICWRALRKRRALAGPQRIASAFRRCTTPATMGPHHRPRTLVTLAPGVRFGPYEILSTLGAGGMGEAYRARDPRPDRAVALSTLASAFGHDAGPLPRLYPRPQLPA